MTTPIWLTGFEHGPPGSFVQGGGLFDEVSVSGGSHSAVTTKKNTGSYALQFVTAADYRYLLKNIPGLPTTAVYRFYFHIDGSLPAENLELCSLGLTVGSTWLSVYFDQATSKIGVGEQGGTLGGTPSLSSSTVAANTWYYVDVRAIVTGGTWTMDWSLNGTAQTRYTQTIAATTIINFSVGTDAANTSTLYFDDIVLSVTSADYPIGAGGTEALVPVSDGTHNAGANVMENQAGADIGAVTAWDLIDDIPMTGATTYIRQLANGTGNYAEVQFGNLVALRSAIIGANGILAYTSATTTGNNGTTIMSKDDFATNTSIWGTTATPADMSDGSTASVYYKSAILANVNDISTVNALEARIGYSSDAAPDPYWINLMVEVAYSLPFSKSLIVLQAVNRAATF